MLAAGLPHSNPPARAGRPCARDPDRSKSPTATRQPGIRPVSKRFTLYILLGMILGIFVGYGLNSSITDAESLARVGLAPAA